MRDSSVTTRVDVGLQQTGRLSEIFFAFLRLGLTSFGGPVAHLGYFRDEFVSRRQWLEEAAYADLVALCQFLPGPASSQVGMALGLRRGGIPGALAAWTGFTLPSALFLTLFGLGLTHVSGFGGGWLHGLKIVAVAVVAQAILGMGRNLCPDRVRASVAVAAAVVALAVPTGLGQIGVIVAGGVIGIWLLRKHTELPHAPFGVRLKKSTGIVALGLFFALLFLLPVIADMSGQAGLLEFDRFYRAGAMVFGGGHVVLPLLQAEVVPRGWVTNDAFLAGYGMAQAVPGPLFTFAAYLGSVSSVHNSSWAGAMSCLVAIFLPAFLLIVGALPFWEQLRRYETMQRAMRGINAAVVGVLIAAFFDPVWSSAIHNRGDFALAAVCFLLLVFWKIPPWIVVLVGAAGGAILG